MNTPELSESPRDRWARLGPEIGTTVRVIDGPERGISATVADVDGWQVTVTTRHGRRLTFDVAQLAAIAVEIIARTRR